MIADGDHHTSITFAPCAGVSLTPFPHQLWITQHSITVLNGEVSTKLKILFTERLNTKHENKSKNNLVTVTDFFEHLYFIYHIFMTNYQITD